MALDIIFMSYDEPHADEHFRLLTDRFPHAKRIHGIKGIREAHVAAANAAQTSCFFVVDADCEITEAAGDVFAYKPPIYDRKYLHLWHSLNAANGLIYGYGGIKLFSKAMFTQLPDGKYVDFSTTMGEGLKMMSGPGDYASITHFNCDSFLAFRGAFREAAKLTHASVVDNEAARRLDVWRNFCYNDIRFGSEVLRGAAAGHIFAQSTTDISNINDIEWLKEQYAIPN